MVKKKEIIKNKPVKKARVIQKKEKFTTTPIYLQPQNLFVVLALIFGLSFLLTTPPFQIPDEASHMFRAYQLSTLHIEVTEQNNVQGNDRKPSKYNRVQGCYLPSNLDSVNHLYTYLIFHSTNKINDTVTAKANELKVNPENQKFTEMTAGIYSFFNYIPQIPAILIGRMLDLNIIPLFYMGRIFALLFYIFCVWYSIKIIPFGKNLFFAISLTPIILAQAGSYSGDCVIIACVFLSLALILYFSTQKDINLQNKKLIFLMSILSLLGVLKPVYAPFVIFLFLIPRKAFVNNKIFFLTIGITFSAALIFTFSWRYLSLATHIVNHSIPQIPLVKKIPMLRESFRLGLIKSYPSMVFTIIGESLIHKGLFYYKSTIGKLGALDCFIPNWIYNSYFIFLFVIAILDYNKNYRVAIYQRIIILGVTLSIFFFIIVFFFVMNGTMEYKTDEGMDTLVERGVQGRYFLPMLIAIFFSLYGILPLKKYPFINTRILPIVIFIFCFATLYSSEHALHLRYYVKGNEYFKYVGGVLTKTPLK